MRVHQTTNLAQDVLDKAAAWYSQQESIPHVFKRVHPEVLEKALELGDNNLHRLVVEDRTTITVMNHPVW